MASTDIRSSLKGVTDSRYLSKVTHYRGISYAKISKRFAKPELNTNWPGKDTDCTKYGPRCPHPPLDVRDLMRIPKDLPQNDPLDENELLCTNLNVTCPTDTEPDKPIPILIWIYGGSQVNAFGTAAQKLADPGPLVAQSIEQGKPIILVTVNYRLNFFGLGDREGEVNLGLQDQRAALAWVKKYIGIFGGDKDNITIGGESAGGIYTHALLATGSLVQRAILASGSLYTTPPQPENRCFGLLGLLEGNLQIMEMEKGNMNPGESPNAFLATTPTNSIVQSMKDLDIWSMWMWQENALQNWKQDEKIFGNLKGLMLGDVAFEGIIYTKQMSKVRARKIAEAFQTTPAEAGQKLIEAYGISEIDDKKSLKASLDFLSDAKFSYPLKAIAENVNKAGGRAYLYQFDQANPFSSAEQQAYHAVDLFAIFGGYDGFIHDEMKDVGRKLRSNWISFVNGDEPWHTDKVFTYGPNGKTGEVSKEEAATRRRTKQFEVLKEVGHETCQQIWLRLLGAAAAAVDDE